MMELNPAQPRKLPAVAIVFEDDDIVAVNKPSGMLTIPDREQSEASLKEKLAKKYGEIFTVHRLDRETSGLVLFAKNEHTHKYLSALFQDRDIEKYYVGIVLGELQNDAGDIHARIAAHPVKKGSMYVHKSGKDSHTGFEVLKSAGGFSMLKYRLHTGRTHQIRVHSREIGHPLVADPLYGDGKPVFISQIKRKYNLAKKEDNERPMLDRLALHAYELRFKKENGEDIVLTADIPKEFRAFFQQLEKAAR